MDIRSAEIACLGNGVLPERYSTCWSGSKTGKHRPHSGFDFRLMISSFPI